MWEAELVGKGVDLGVLEKLVAGHVHIRDRGVLLERALTGDLFGEVVASVEEFEEAADGVEVLAGQLDLPGLSCARNCQFTFAEQRRGR